MQEEQQQRCVSCGELHKLNVFGLLQGRHMRALPNGVGYVCEYCICYICDGCRCIFCDDLMNPQPEKWQQMYVCRMCSEHQRPDMQVSNFLDFDYIRQSCETCDIKFAAQICGPLPATPPQSFQPPPSSQPQTSWNHADPMIPATQRSHLDPRSQSSSSAHNLLTRFSTSVATQAASSLVVHTVLNIAGNAEDLVHTVGDAINSAADSAGDVVASLFGGGAFLGF